MKREKLDLVLVPSGLVLLLVYHIWLLCQIKWRPTKTVIGTNAMSRRIWVRAMMEDPAKNGVLAVQTLRNTIMASTLLASTAIMLSSLIAVLIVNGGHMEDFLFEYGSKSKLVFSVKFFSILVCFLVAFFLNVQSIRYYSHASILINVPLKDNSPSVSADYVARTVNMGSYFWSLGLRACYLSFPLFLWIFGPIPMFICCFVLACLLYFLDMSPYGGVTKGRADDEGNRRG